MRPLMDAVVTRRNRDDMLVVWTSGQRSRDAPGNEHPVRRPERRRSLPGRVSERLGGGPSACPASSAGQAASPPGVRVTRSSASSTSTDVCVLAGPRPRPGRLPDRRNRPDRLLSRQQERSTASTSCSSTGTTCSRQVAQLEVHFSVCGDRARRLASWCRHVSRAPGEHRPRPFYGLLRSEWAYSIRRTRKSLRDNSERGSRVCMNSARGWRTTVDSRTEHPAPRD